MAGDDDPEAFIDLADFDDFTRWGIATWLATGVAAVVVLAPLAGGLYSVSLVATLAWTGLYTLLSGRQWQSVWHRGLAVDAPVPQPSIIQAGWRTLPLLWRAFGVVFVVIGVVVGVLELAGVRSHVTDVPLYLQILVGLGCGTPFAVALILIGGRRSAQRSGQRRAGRVLILHDPTMGVGVDRPHRQAYIWFAEDFPPSGAAGQGADD